MIYRFGQSRNSRVVWERWSPDEQNILISLCTPKRTIGQDMSFVVIYSLHLCDPGHRQSHQICEVLQHVGRLPESCSQRLVLPIGRSCTNQGLTACMNGRAVSVKKVVFPVAVVALPKHVVPKFPAACCFCATIWAYCARGHDLPGPDSQPTTG